MGAEGNIFVRVAADTVQFVRGLKKGGKENRQFRGGLMKTSKVLGGFRSMLLKVGGAAAMIGLARAATKTTDSLAKTAKKLGLTTEELAGLRHAAIITGNATKQLDIGLQRMTRRIAEAAHGTGEAKAAIKELGLDAAALARKSPAQAFRDIADAMARVPAQSDRIRLGFKLFDAEGVGLINTLAKGRDGLDRLAQEAKDLGLAPSEEEAGRVERFVDAITRMKSAFVGLATQGLVSAAKGLSAVLTIVTSAVKQIKSLSAGVGGSVLKFTAFAAAVSFVTVVIFKVVGVIIKLVDAFKNATKASIVFQAFSGPAGWAALAVSIGVVAGTMLVLDNALKDVADGASEARGELNELADTKPEVVVNFRFPKPEILVADSGIIDELNDAFADVTKRVGEQSNAVKFAIDPQNTNIVSEQVREYATMIDVLQRMAPAQELAKKTIESMQTPTEAFTEKLAALNHWMVRDHLSSNQLAHGIRQLQEELAAADVTAVVGDFRAVDIAAEQLTEQIRRQSETFGLSGVEAEAYRLRLLGISDAVGGELTAALEDFNRKQERQDLGRSAKRLFESTRTPMEQFTKKLREIQKLASEGLIDPETIKRALEKAATEMKGSELGRMLAGGPKAFQFRFRSDVGPARRTADPLAKLDATNTKSLEQITRGNSISSDTRDLIKELVKLYEDDEPFSGSGV